MHGIRRCTRCKQAYDTEAVACPNCGLRHLTGEESVRLSFGKLALLGVVAVWVGLALVVSFDGSSSRPGTGTSPVGRITDRLAREQCEETSRQLETRIRRAASTLTEKGVRTTALEAARGLQAAVSGTVVTNCTEALAAWMVLYERR